MKLTHKNCGGSIQESKIIPAYNSEEYGIVPAYECSKCKIEILGDVQIEFVPESNLDRIQIEAIVEASK
jgi:hypothetical protein